MWHVLKLALIADAAQSLMDVVSRVALGNHGETTGSLLLVGPPGVGEFLKVLITLWMHRHQPALLRSSLAQVVFASCHQLQRLVKIGMYLRF